MEEKFWTLEKFPFLAAVLLQQTHFSMLAFCASICSRDKRTGEKVSFRHPHIYFLYTCTISCRLTVNIDLPYISCYIFIRFILLINFPCISSHLTYFILQIYFHVVHILHYFSVSIILYNQMFAHFLLMHKREKTLNTRIDI